MLEFEAPAWQRARQGVRQRESPLAVGEPGGGDRFDVELLVGQRLEPGIAAVKPVARAAKAPTADHAGESR